MSTRSPRELAYLTGLTARNAELAEALTHGRPSADSDSATWFAYLNSLKSIVGNSDNDMSFVAALMAKEYLATVVPVQPFDVGDKAQGAPGLDLDEMTIDGRRIIAEIKTTTPYHGNELGAAQKASFEKDFLKLNAAQADLKYFFVTDRKTFDLVAMKYRNRILGVNVVLLPQGEVVPADSSTGAAK